MREDHPIFEIVQPDRHIKIYANGVVEGVDGRVFIVNHISSLTNRSDLLSYFSKSQSESLPQRSTDVSLRTGGTAGTPLC